MHGDWKYLYRAIDRDGVLVDVMPSEHRNLAAAKRFFRSAKAITGVIPDRVTTNSGTSSALDLACANTFPPLLMRRTAIALGMSQLLEQETLQPRNVAPCRLES